MKEKHSRHSKRDAAALPDGSVEGQQPIQGLVHQADNKSSAESNGARETGRRRRKVKSHDAKYGISGEQQDLTTPRRLGMSRRRWWRRTMEEILKRQHSHCQGSSGAGEGVPAGGIGGYYSQPNYQSSRCPCCKRWRFGQDPYFFAQIPPPNARRIHVRRPHYVDYYMQENLYLQERIAKKRLFNCPPPQECGGEALDNLAQSCHSLTLHDIAETTEPPMVTPEPHREPVATGDAGPTTEVNSQLPEYSSQPQFFSREMSFPLPVRWRPVSKEPIGLVPKSKVLVIRKRSTKASNNPETPTVSAPIPLTSQSQILQPGADVGFREAYGANWTTSGESKGNNRQSEGAGQVTGDGTLDLEVLTRQLSSHKFFPSR